MEQNTKETEKVLNSILSIVKHDLGDRVRMEMRYNLENIFNPDLKGVVSELFAQNNANYINKFASEHKHFPTTNDVPELVRRTRMKTKDDVAGLVMTAMMKFVDNLLNDMDGFINPSLERAREILVDEIR